MGDGTKENPYTHKDVLKLIEERGGTANGLNLSEKSFEAGIDLSGLELEGIILEKARFPTRFEGQEPVSVKFNGSNLNRADLRGINLEYAQFSMLNDQPTCLEGADLRGTILLNANFQGAKLSAATFGLADDKEYSPATLENTDFRNATLFLTNFTGCYFYGTKLEGAYTRGADILKAHLEEAKWGNYKSGDENKKDYYSAEHRYRELKVWYKQSGYDDIAAKFYYREREAGRKGAKRRRDHVSGWFTWAFFGHGEGWKRILFWMTGFVLFFALIYFAIGTLTPNTFSNSLYYSAVSFTALGYGSWVKEGTGLVKGLGAFEAFVGVFMMALLLVTFVRKWTR
jgi:hypothetical protein